MDMQSFNTMERKNSGDVVLKNTIIKIIRLEVTYSLIILIRMDNSTLRYH